MPMPKNFKLVEPKITDAVAGAAVDLVAVRRTRFCEGVSHQIGLAKDAKFQYEIERRTKAKGPDGKPIMEKIKKAPRPMFKTSGDAVELSLRYGNRPLFGKQVIQTNKDKLITTLEALKKQGADGQFDPELATAAARSKKTETPAS